jgi:hypothetical protein
MHDRFLVLAALGILPRALALGQAAAAPSGAAAPQIQFEVTTIPVGKPVAGFREETLTVSPDGKRVAYVAGQVGNIAVPDPAPPPLLPVAIEAERKGGVEVVVDGERFPQRTPHVLIGGPRGGFTWATIPVFSADGRHVAYSAGLGPSTTVVIDGTEGKPCKRVAPCVSIGAPVFSPDGKHIGYPEKRHKLFSMGPRWRIASDDAEGHDYDRVGHPVFSPSSERVAYIAWDEKDGLLVIDAKETKAVKADALGDPRFSPDGHRIAYTARRGKEFFVVLDGKPGDAYDQVGLPRFHPDGRLTYAARRGKIAIIVTEGSPPLEQPEYSRVGDPVVSTDGKHVAYWAYDGAKERVVVDGIAGTPYDEIGWLAFGPDDKHLAFEARLGSQWRLVVDGVEGPEYGRVKGMTVERERRDLVHRNGWIFEGTADLSYVGLRDGELVRWRVKVAGVPAPIP